MGCCRIHWLSIYSDTPPFDILTIVPIGPQSKEACAHHLVSMAIPGVPPPPHFYIGTKFYPPYFGTKIGKYNFFPQTCRSIVSINIAKAGFSYKCGFCFDILNEVCFVCSMFWYIASLLLLALGHRFLCSCSNYTPLATNKSLSSSSNFEMSRICHLTI